MTSAEQRWEGYQQRLELEKNSLVSNLSFRNVGPTIMGGRVVDLEVDPDDPMHFYVAYASGSLWETTNSGTSFTPLFDNQMVMTIGDIAVDWINDIIYVGTGENNSSRSSYSGYGVFRSNNNGKTWKHIGLEETHHIGRMVLHPTNSGTIWVAALGHLYSENAERGIYKSTDGGDTWKKTLFINDRTGVVDLVIHPEKPNLLIAAAWEKDRKAWNFEESGAGTALYRSEDAGDSWKEIANDSGFPDTKGSGRIGLSFAPSNPNIVYAILDNQDRREKKVNEEKALSKTLLQDMNKVDFLELENKEINAFLDEYKFPSKYNAVDIKEDIRKDVLMPQDLVSYIEDANSLLFDTPVKGGEMYRSDNAGKTWIKTHDGYIEDMIYTYGYYFGQVRVDPQNSEIVYTMGVPIIKSNDGGKTFLSINEENVHVDHHALWINPKNSNHLILGNDGGIYISFDAGSNWINCNSPSVGQFYSIAVDMAEPYNVYGGLQDNGVWKGSSTYEYSRGWYKYGKYPYERLMGGDGMQVAVDTRNNKILYTGYQFGNYFRINTETGEKKYITPKHKLGEVPFRWNWEAPILISAHNQDIVYFGSNHFHRSMDQGENFETLSRDLTTGGKKGDVSFGTLTTIAESPVRFGLLYVGSDDGLIHISKDAGESWIKITDALPKNYWVSAVVASNHSEGRVYASLNGYRWDNFEPMVFISENYGKTWKNISLGLPKEPVNVIKEDPENDQIIYIGTDHSAYVSLDRGDSYHAFLAGLPNVSIHDLIVHPREKDLVLGTHGRGIYIGDVSSLQQLNKEIMAKPLHLFEPAPITFSSKWGTRQNVWASYNEPSVSFSYYSSSSGDGSIEVLKENEVVSTLVISATQGLNFINLNLETTASFKNTLNEEQANDFKAQENGKFYLTEGNYQLRVSIKGNTEKVGLVIKPERKQSSRKG